MQTDAQADTDPVDEVEFTDGETIETVVDKLLNVLGIPVEVKENWNARVNIITDETGEKRASVSLWLGTLPLHPTWKSCWFAKVVEPCLCIHEWFGVSVKER